MSQADGTAPAAHPRPHPFASAVAAVAGAFHRRSGGARRDGPCPEAAGRRPAQPDDAGKRDRLISSQVGHTG